MCGASRATNIMTMHMRLGGQQPKSSRHVRSLMTDLRNREKVWYTNTSRKKPRVEDSSHAVSTARGNFTAASKRARTGANEQRADGCVAR